MVAVIDLNVDVGIVADQEEAERLARQVIDDELGRARSAITQRLTTLGVEVSLR
jgi:hypothetical protein